MPSLKPRTSPDRAAYRYGPKLLEKAPTTLAALPDHLAGLRPSQRRAVWVSAVVECIEDGTYDRAALIAILKTLHRKGDGWSPGNLATMIEGASLGQVCRWLVSIREGKPLVNAVKPTPWGATKHPITKIGKANYGKSHAKRRYKKLKALEAASC
jgi:hypothetical protein